MPTSMSHRAATRLFAIAALLAIATVGIGCSETSSDTAAEPTPTPTATVVPTPTHEHEGPPHSIMEVGSTEVGGGMLAVNEIFTAFVVESACLGGAGDECTGGTVVYTGDSPGFDDVESEDPALPLYTLPDGTEVSVEITAIDPDASLLISGTVLDQVGETAVVNTSPELHNHPTWQVVGAGGTHPKDKSISLRLHADGFDPSDEITVTLSLFEDDDHDGDE